ncbi:MAG: hypothetical protein Roseis2KO_43920 [Roseivirga sp.]
MNDTLRFIMLFAVLQGVILLLALANKRQRSIAANQVLTAFVSSICLLLLLVVLSVEATWGRSVGYLSDSVGLLYGPLFYFYVLRLLTISGQKLWPHLAPFLLFVLLNTLWLLIEPAGIWVSVQTTFYSLMSAGSLLQIMIYLVLSWRIMLQYRQKIREQQSQYQTFRYLRVLVLIIFTCVLMFSINYISQLAGWSLPFAFLDYFIGWLLLSAFVFVLAYYAIRQPEIFRVNPVAKSQNDTVTDINISGLLEKLQHCLTKERPYRNPDLSLDDLARLVNCRKELLSKAINQGLSTNFYRLINEHRIGEFEMLAKDPSNAHLTHLALALEAGFRSKTTFYKAFRELKQVTPGAYLKSK